MSVTKNFYKYLPHALFVVVLLLLILHVFGLRVVEIDNTTILLIVLLMTVPLSSQLRRIKWGDFEAEIQPEEVRKIEKELSEIPPDNTPRPFELNEIIDSITELIETDHVLGLAKLRLELEKVLLKIASDQNIEFKNKSGILSLIRFLEKEEKIDSKLISPIKDVVAIANRAVHGEDISKVTASEIIDVGIDLLYKLYRELYSLISKPVSIEGITEKQRDGFQFGSYQVTTVVPLAESPYMNRYQFNQEQLDQFLENYDEFAEFIVEVKKINQV